MALEQAYVVLFDSSDTETGTAANPLRVDPTGTTPQPVSGTVTANQGAPAIIGNAWPILITDGVITCPITTTVPTINAPGLIVRLAGPPLAVTMAQPTTGTVTSAAVTTIVSTILAVNTARLGASFWNNGAAACYIRLSAAATTVLFSVRISNKGFYELQFPSYTGIVSAIVAAGACTILVTELT